MGSQHNKQEMGIGTEQTSINDFYLHQVIGEGGFGRVMSSIYLKDKKKSWYAVKEINKFNLLQHKLGFEMIAGELDALKRLGSGHPFITTLHFAFHDLDNCYFVFDLVTDHDLRHYLKRRVTFTEKTVAFYVSCLSSALAYIHRHGIVHRDIKPENIILDKSGFPHIADFGVAHVETQENSTYPLCHLASGTKQYLSPEVFTVSHAHGPEADYWSLGVTAYELLYGKRPFRAHVPHSFIKYLKDMTNSDSRSPKRRAGVKTSLSVGRVFGQGGEGSTSSTCVSSNPSSPSRSTGSSQTSQTGSSDKKAPSAPHLGLAPLNLHCIDAVTGMMTGMVLAPLPEYSFAATPKLPFICEQGGAAHAGTDPYEDPSGHFHREHNYYYNDLWFVEADTPLQCKLAIPTAEHEFKHGHAEPELSTACKSMLRGLLEVRPSHRLGYNTLEKLCRHKWFVEMQCVPPDKIAMAMPANRLSPQIAAQADSDNDLFDADSGLGDGCFQSERVSPREQERFVGFDYVALEHRSCIVEQQTSPTDSSAAASTTTVASSSPSLPSVAAYARHLSDKVFSRSDRVADPASGSPSGVADRAVSPWQRQESSSERRSYLPLKVKKAPSRAGSRADFFAGARKKVGTFPLIGSSKLF